MMNTIRTFLSEKLSVLSADALGWLAAIVIHCATIPSLIALMTGLSDRTPNLDMVMFLWTALFLLFAKAIVQKDLLNVVTIGLGFFIQAGFMAMILFR